MKTKTSEEVASRLVEIFCTFGAPCILQLDNGREFRNNVINLKLSQVLVERANQLY
jgi:hypothetical protein